MTQMANTHEKAAEQRYWVRELSDRYVLVRSGESEQLAQLINVSEGGALIDTDLELPLDRSVTVCVPGSNLAVGANVRRAVSGAAAVQFDDETIGRIITGWARAPI
jgi:hypothetical protein